MAIIGVNLIDGEIESSSTVTDETTWGVTPAVGSSGTYSDGAHTHGTPANPISEQAFIADPSGGTVQDSEARTAINSILDALIANGIIASS